MFKKKETGLDIALKVTALVTIVASFIATVYGFIMTKQANSWLNNNE